METVTTGTDEAQPKEQQGTHTKEQAENAEKSTEEGGAPSTSEASETPAVESADVIGDADPPEEEERMEGVSTDNPGDTTPTESGSSVPVSTLEDWPAVTSDPATEKQAPAHVFQESWTKLSKEVLVDKIKGVIYGQAIGDAFGLATEFLSRKAAKKHYKTGPKGYSDIIQDFHRSRWDKGDWTDDTDQMLLILRMINDRGGHVHKVDFARRLYDWMRYGFKELGDVGGMGIGMTVHRTLTHPGFLKDPHESANDVWEMSGRYLAPNGAIMRTSILGILNFNDITKVVANTTEICKVTHADPRCVASCIAVTTAIAMILKGENDLTAKNGLKLLIEAATEEAVKVMEHKDQCEEMRTHIHSSLEGLKLDEQESIGYTFKALGAGFYGLRQSLEKSFRDIILEVIMEAGDADSNGAVCGALTGCVVGFKALPEDLLRFPHRTWLDQQVDNFLTTIGLKEL